MTYSLRIKFLLPLLFGGTLLAVLGSLLSYQATLEQLRVQLLERGHLLGLAIDEATKIANNDVEIRFAVEEIIKKEVGVYGITVATKDPFVIWASSFHPGTDPDLLTQHMLKSLKQSISHGIFGHHFEPDGDLEMLLPLSLRIADESLDASPPSDFVASQEIDPLLLESGDVPDSHQRLPSSAYRGAIYLLFDWTEIQKTSSGMLWFSIFTFLTGIAVITLLATIILYKTVLRPIDTIAAVMRRQHKGERNARVPDMKHDEIGELGLAFNNMLNAMTESEDKHRLLFETMSQGVVYQDESGKIFSANYAAQEILGLSLDQMLGKTSVDPRWKTTHENGEDFPADSHPAIEALRTGKVINNVVMGVYHPKEHQHHWVIVNAMPQFRLGEDKPYQVYTTFNDITELKQQEELLHRSQKMDALGKLTGGIAHDYNNLLGIIMGYAEQLSQHLSHDSRLAKYAQDIQHAAQRGEKLTNKLLAFSRHKAPDAKVLDINTLLQEQRLMLEKTLTARIKLEFDLAQDLWPICLDSGDLEDAIVNMSINAMHAMVGQGQLTLKTSNEQLNEMETRILQLDAGDYVVLSIIDTGCGMDEVTKEKIFEPFYSTKGKQGTGLGLSQVYGFVERSGGAIKVYSEPGHGTRFALYFPRSHQTVTQAQAPITNTALNLQGNETLLVVDDEQAMVELAHDILTAQGYRVLTANDGEQALAILEKEAVDLIITDVIMPNMDGYQLAAQVQQRYPNINIQMVSGFADDRHHGMTDDALHQNMLHKPYSSNTLLARVRSLLDKTCTKDTLAGRTVLVMDDDESVRELFKINLAKLGCKTIPACDGEEAIDLYQQSLKSDEPIDVIIMDLSIPGGQSGKDVADKIRVLDPSAKLIVSSGHSEGPEMLHYQDYGFNGALEKNFNREKIKRVLEQVLSL